MIRKVTTNDVHDGHAVGEDLLAEQARRRRRRRGPSLKARLAEEVGVGEQADQERADEAADEVDADHVEGVVVAGLGLEPHGEAADDAGDGADADRRHAGDEAGARGDGHQAGDDARRRTEVGEVTVTEPLHEHPGEAGGGGGEEGVDERLDGLAVGGERPSRR